MNQHPQLKTIEAIREQVDLVDIINEEDEVVHKAGGGHYRGVCPFCDDASGFTVHAVRQFYHCFWCGESGDVFKYLMTTVPMSFDNAVNVLKLRIERHTP